MSNKDITRFLDQPEKHYAAGRLQQSRPLVDSDYNESHQLFERDRQTALLAMLGPKASPAQGFAIGGSVALGRALPSRTRPLMEGDRIAVDSVLMGGLSHYVHGATVLPGSLYVGGLRFEQVSLEPVALQRGFLQMRPGNGLPYLTELQSPSPDSPHSPRLVYSPSSPDSPFSPESPSPDSPNSPDFPSFRNFYYLNAWEQTVTAVEDEELLESALSGPDTTVRVRRMHRVEVLGKLPGYIDTCGEAFEELIRQLEANQAEFDRKSYELKSKGRLQLVFQEPELRDQCEACTMDPEARYLGQENHAVRLMLTQAYRYVWAFDNAAPLYRIKVTGLSAANPTDVTVHLLTPPKDAEHFPRRNRVVEILPFAAVLDGAEHLKPDHPHFQKIAAEIGAFLRVKDDYDPSTGTFKLETGPTGELTARIQQLKQFITSWDSDHPANTALDMRDKSGGDARYFYLRIWHLAEHAWDIERPCSSSPYGAPLGNTGLVPVFHAAGRAGDTWLATLRIDEPYRLTPYALLTEPGGVPPQGPRHYFAPLALVRGRDHEVSAVADCRKTIQRVTERSCATRTVGDGQVSFGDYKTLQAAVDSLPIEGGTVLIYPGEYRQAVSIIGRGKVTLKGCGPATILEPLLTPTESNRPPVVTILRSDAIRIEDLTIHATTDAVRIENASNVTLRNVSLVAGTVVARGFDSSTTSDAFWLVHAKNVMALELTSLSLLAGRRQAILLDTVSEARLTHLDNSGEPENSLEVSTRSYLQVRNSDNISLEDSTLVFQSRLGVLLEGSTAVELSSVSLEGMYVNQTTPARTVLSVGNDCDNVSIAESRFKLSATYLVVDEEEGGLSPFTSNVRSPDAVLTLGGQDTRLEDCSVEVDAESEGVIWGGVWVLSGSQRLILRNNRIFRGYGHGITLGSVQWEGGSPFTVLSPRPGPGAGGMSLPTAVDTGSNYASGTFGTLSVPSQPDFTPTYDEGPIEELVIADNHIEGMGTNGISTLAFSTGESPPELVRLETVTLERNTITGNLQGIVNALPDDTSITMLSSSVLNKTERLFFTVLPFGGIVLGAVGGSTMIRGNTITGNRPTILETDDPDGNDPRRGLPINGVFLWVGDDVTVCDNRIVENGFVLPSVMPAGLTISAGVRAGIAVLAAGAQNVNYRYDVNNLAENHGDTTYVSSVTSALRVFGNTVRHPEGRALHGLCYGTAAVFGNFFSSDGNRGAASIPTETSLVGDVVFVEDLAYAWEQGGTIPSEHLPYTNGAANPRVVTPGSDVATTLTTLPATYRANGRGGHLLFSSNQVTYAWEADHPDGGYVPIAYYPVALYSLDHVGVHGNQLVCRAGTWNGNVDVLGNYALPLSSPTSPVRSAVPLVTQLFASGHTVNVSLNRFAESLDASLFSGVAYGQFLGIVANNQGSHTFGCYGPKLVNLGPPRAVAGEKPRNVLFGNQVLYGTPNLPAPRGLRVFFERQFRIVDDATVVYPAS